MMDVLEHVDDDRGLVRHYAAKVPRAPTSGDGAAFGSMERPRRVPRAQEALSPGEIETAMRDAGLQIAAVPLFRFVFHRGRAPRAHTTDPRAASSTVITNGILARVCG
jgi:hypothetical protein